MKSQRLNYSEDLSTVNRRNKRVKTLDKEVQNVLPIPIDLVFEIFSRLPVKSIARCRCVSKIWAFMLRRTEFTELFLSKSYVRPQLLFAYQNGRELLVFTSPQPQNPGDNSAPIIANYHMSLSFDDNSITSHVVNGLVCVIKNKRSSNGWCRRVPVICNPSTGESLPLKKLNTRNYGVRSMFGYDPIDKRFKVLSMAWGRSGLDEKHRVMTLGTDKWRRVECCIPGQHSYTNKELCINGVMYYQSIYPPMDINEICCFDIKSEKFSFIKFSETLRYSTLINYNGNLGLIWSVDGFFDQTSTSSKLWVLEDVEKQEWSKRNLVLPSMWKDVVGENRLGVVGVTSTNEIVFQAIYPSHPFPLYLFYFSTDKNTIVRVEVQGLGMYKHGGIRIFMNHVEDVKLF